jgi:AcrR family transcriptional regulator
MATVHRHKQAAPKPRGEAFVQAVLDVTLIRLAEVGFERLSIPDIAELAGVNKTSIYRRWLSKAELVRDALEVAMKHAEQAPDTGSLRGDLIELARTVADFTKSRVGTAIIRIMLAEGGNPQVRALGNTAYREVGPKGPRSVLKRAVERGELNRDVDGSLVLFTIAGAIMHRLFVEQRSVPDTYIRQLIDLVLMGAAPKR